MTTAYRRVHQFVKTKRVARFAIASLVAAGTSAVVFPLMYLLGASTTACTIVAFAAGAVPNWTINRRWTWQVEGRVAFGREIVAYVLVSATTLLLLSVATAASHHAVGPLHIAQLFKTAIVTASYFGVLAVLYGARFLLYEFWIFSGRSRIRAALRSRRQVWIAARANRIP
jgi:putative flippase GtrA